MRELYIGVMSGTSLDGVDVVLCKINKTTCELICSAEYPFDKDLKEDILTLINSKTTLKSIGEIDIRLGNLYSECLCAFIRHNEIDTETIKAIGLHGQTLWHEPNGEFPFSMQLGNANTLTENTGVSVISDFRQKDIALGGQGAPLTPAFHKEVFSHIQKNVAVLNIGGMANISILGEKLLGYDTGTGNVLLDLWISKKLNLSYDKDGSFGDSGHANDELLQKMLKEEYFSKPAPKSCGRELFNEAWLTTKLQNFSHLSDADVQATLLELSVESIVNEVLKTDTELLLVCGGGAKNSALMRRLKTRLKDIEVKTTDDKGVSADYMEAMAFAWLAYKRVHKEKVDIKSVTGARENSILGCIYE
ncbi:anhydro-N-acetylmuramic acid kinase [Sulfurimonas sp.]|nr:anhydro-N-acetylmuramic acid kinase [Sulfurimonas sp.]